VGPELNVVGVGDGVSMTCLAVSWILVSYGEKTR
jgi:hypothetical protein